MRGKGSGGGGGGKQVAKCIQVDFDCIRLIAKQSTCIPLSSSFTFKVVLFTAKTEHHADLCSSQDSEYGKMTAFCSQKLLSL
jgi:hypothetical protein